VMTLLFSKKERQSKEDVFKDLLLGKETEEKYKHDCEGLVPAWIHLFTLEDAVDGAIEFFQQFFDDTIINVEDNQLVLFSKEKLPIEDLRNISDSIQTELLTKASISRGSYAETVDELPLSYENAIRTHKAGLRIGKADNVFVYEELVGPLMVQLLDKKDIGELTFAIKKLWIDNLNDELVGTAKAFFENNLNITDTANKLFIHRNTLIYRINKIQKITGYDIRKFEHGINLYILLLCESL